MQSHATPKNHHHGHHNSQSSRNQRRFVKQYITDPFRQVRFGLYYVALNLTSFAGLAYVFWSTSTTQYNQLLELFNVTGDEKSKVLLNDVFNQNLILVGSVFAVLTIATLALTIWLTHRIYGPQIAITKFIREIARGNYGARLRLRKKDEFHTLAEEMNQMATALDNGHHAAQHRRDGTNDAGGTFGDRGGGSRRSNQNHKGNRGGHRNRGRNNP